jgi:hypothetical protein
MRFRIPNSHDSFEIPDEWWGASSMEGYIPDSTHYRIAQTGSIIVPITEVEPPRRIDGRWFRDRHTVVKLLQGMRNGVALPPIKVWSKGKRSALYSVKDGFHRFYLSIAVGFTEISLDINDFDLDEFLANEARDNQCAI